MLFLKIILVLLKLVILGFMIIFLVMMRCGRLLFIIGCWLFIGCWGRNVNILWLNLLFIILLKTYIRIGNGIRDVNRLFVCWLKGFLFFFIRDRIYVFRRVLRNIREVWRLSLIVMLLLEFLIFVEERKKLVVLIKE